MSPSLVASNVALVALVAALVAAIVRTKRRPGPLGTLRIEGDELVLRLDGVTPLLAMHRTLRVPLSAVRSTRHLPAGVPEGLTLRVCGTGWPGLAIGLFWRRERGFCFVLRRRDRAAVEIEIGGRRRIQQWIIEAGAAGEVLRRLDVPAAIG